MELATDSCSHGDIYKAAEKAESAFLIAVRYSFDIDSIRRAGELVIEQRSMMRPTDSNIRIILRIGEVIGIGQQTVKRLTRLNERTLALMEVPDTIAEALKA